MGSKNIVLFLLIIIEIFTSLENYWVEGDENGTAWIVNFYGIWDNIYECNSENHTI
jgi:hypothetical protein